MPKHTQCDKPQLIICWTNMLQFARFRELLGSALTAHQEKEQPCAKCTLKPKQPCDNDCVPGIHDTPQKG